MHKSDLVGVVADATHLEKHKADAAVSAAIEHITNALARGETVALVGFGSFVVKTRAARTGRSPRTGETIHIPASKSVGFKPGKALKDAVQA